MIFISTGGYSNQNAYEVSKIFNKNSIFQIELSGGKYKHDIIKDIKKLKKNSLFKIHNYFPPPENPFVFNLASKNNQINDRSVKHALKCIKICKEIGISEYSFHGGFLFDPNFMELGSKIDKSILLNYSDAEEIFLKGVNFLSQKAKELGVSLLIENNVLSDENFKNFECNPLMMVTENQIKSIMEKTPKNVNFLLDVAHLKVSAKSLGFDPVNLILSCSKWVKAIHISDNDGIKDTNNIISHNSWFWPYIKKLNVDITLEVYNISVEELCKQKIIAEECMEHMAVYD